MWETILKLFLLGKGTGVTWTEHHKRSINISRCYTLDGKRYVVEVRELKPHE